MFMLQVVPAIRKPRPFYSFPPVFAANGKAVTGDRNLSNM